MEGEYEKLPAQKIQFHPARDSFLTLGFRLLTPAIAIGGEADGDGNAPQSGESLNREEGITVASIWNVLCSTMRSSHFTV